MTVGGESGFQVRRFSDDFARILRERILTGQLAAGERLNEVQPSKEFGISRSPIREALQALSGEGLVQFVAGRGAFAGGLSVEEARDIRKMILRLTGNRRLEHGECLRRARRGSSNAIAEPARGFDRLHSDVYIRMQCGTAPQRREAFNDEHRNRCAGAAGLLQADDPQGRACFVRGHGDRVV